jgi:hypothetical protein
MLNNHSRVQAEGDGVDGAQYNCDCVNGKGSEHGYLVWYIQEYDLLECTRFRTKYDMVAVCGYRVVIWVLCRKTMTPVLSFDLLMPKIFCSVQKFLLD